MTRLEQDRLQLDAILSATLSEAQAFLRSVDERPVAVAPQPSDCLALPAAGLGATEALSAFMARYGQGLSGSAGARYFGFVTGGVTPAALAGDWLTSTFDQNATGYGDSVAPLIELEAVSMLLALFGLPSSFAGSFVTGATMSNFTALALARQWVGKQQGLDIAQTGLAKPLQVFAGTAHSSVYKALAMLGLGRQSLEQVDLLAAREAIDINALELCLQRLQGEPCVVVASAGTVNTVDYDDISAMVALKEKYPFWLHVDAAFGGFAAVSAPTKHLVAGWEQADSVTVDAHKWLNVPYDAALMFTRHPDLQVEVFQNAAVYLGEPSTEPNFVHRTPENSRRLRALPAWLTLQAYGSDGYQSIVERCCGLARQLGFWIDQSSYFKLLAPVSMNGICFTFASGASTTGIATYLKALAEAGAVFLTATNLHGTPAIRVSITNWRTTEADIERAWKDMVKVYESIS